MSKAMADHMSMIDRFTEDFSIPDFIPENERYGRLESHVVKRFSEKGISNETALIALQRWLSELRAAQRLCATPGKDPEPRYGERAPIITIDMRTGLVVSPSR